LKIAVASDDEVNISQHFGRASHYVVLTVEDGKVVERGTRAKAGHQTCAAHEPPKLAPGEKHGYDSGSEVRHESMVEAISDCQVLIAGGMGWGAYESMREHGIETIVTDVKAIGEAVGLYLAANLPNLTDRLH